MLQVPGNEENRVIKHQYKLLMTSCRYISNPADRSLIRRAFRELLVKFRDRRRDTGELFLFHAVAVARIVADEMELDSTSIISALLHEVSLESPESGDSVGPNFGKKVSGIVSSLRRISELRMEKVSIHPENFIQLLLSMSADIRVILIMLADRLNLMRLIDALPHQKQQQISLETSGLYAPLAHRLGLYRIKAELEELAMKHAYPEVYESIARKIEESREEQAKYFRQFIAPIKKELSDHGLSFEIKFRTKSIPSIWNKMRKQNIDFEQVYDFFAIRIITQSNVQEEKADCWKAYSLVTNIYPPNPSRLRDWISSPKSSGYESLHTTVAGPRSKWIEVQIRSRRMDEAAEMGRAAHWRYKESPATAADTADKWLSNVRSVLENFVPGDEEMEGSHRPELFSDYIYAFTPQGDLKKLRAGATVLDFAFEVHSQIGQKCSGAKVNNLFVPLKYVLKTGDQVEIITSRNQKPNKDWLGYVTTTKAIAKIKRCLKEAEFSQADTGKGMLIRKLSQFKVNYTDDLGNKLVTYYKAVSSLDLFHGIAEGKFDLQKIKDAITPPARPEEIKLPEKPFTKAQPATRKHSQKSVVIINENTPIEDVKLARCCQPVYGDEIFGFVTVAEGIKIHRVSCTNATQMLSKYAYRVVTARWAEKEEVSAYLATIKITGDDQVGMLNQISDTITRGLNANIRSINLSSRNGKFEGSLTINVDGKSHLELIIARLSKLKGVKRVLREK